jgi:hypothetical protein
VNFSATANSITSTASLTILPIGVQLLTLAPETIKGGVKATGTATLQAAAAPGSIVVTLTSSNTAVLTVPATITVAKGTLDASFVVSSKPVSVSTVVTITATANGTTQTVKVTLTP